MKFVLPNFSFFHKLQSNQIPFCWHFIVSCPLIESQCQVGCWLHCKYLQPNYSLITAKRLYLRLNYSHWQCTVIGCNSIQPIYSSDTVFDCNYEFFYMHGKFSNFWLQFGCTKQELVWYEAFNCNCNWYIFLILERFCD